MAALAASPGSAAITVNNPGFDTGTGGQIAGVLTLVAGTSTAGPLQIGTSAWYGRSVATNLVVAVPVAGFRAAIAVNNSGTNLGNAEINYTLGPSLGGLAGLELPEADLWQPITGTSLVANSTYILGVDVDAGSLLSASSFAGAGFGIGLSTGASATTLGTMFSDSLTNPALLDISLLSGTNQRLTLTFTTGGSVPGGDIGIVLFGGRGTQTISLGLLQDYHMDNVSLVLIPEPGPVALWALGTLVLLRRRR
ncbi:hypothetical protein llg_12270 [Luteolibacter sp. LG18]|nr:hypothetical protein llg_12270 [Luteolibacter sp. LG18]